MEVIGSNNIGDENLYSRVTREMYLDQFLWLLKMNILKYYVIDVEKSRGDGN